MSKAIVGVLLAASLCLPGCADAAKAKKADISQDLDKLKGGMSMDEVMALFGKPKKRTDGPQVAEPDPPGYQAGQMTEVFSESGTWNSRNPVEREVIKAIQMGWSMDHKRPDLNIEASTGAEKVSWLYMKEKPQLVLLVLAFYDGKLGSADLFTVNSPVQGK